MYAGARRADEGNSDLAPALDPRNVSTISQGWRRSNGRTLTPALSQRARERRTLGEKAASSLAPSGVGMSTIWLDEQARGTARPFWLAVPRCIYDNA